MKEIRKEKNVTIKDIAKICGVGVSTVSRAINDTPGISAETKEHVLNVIRESNYISNNSARNLKRLESETIAVLVKGIDNPFFSPMIAEFASVSVDDERESFRIVDYLCGLGHKKIAILAASPDDESIGGLRMNGLSMIDNKKRLNEKVVFSGELVVGESTRDIK